MGDLRRLLCSKISPEVRSKNKYAVKKKKGVCVGGVFYRLDSILETKNKPKD